MNVPNATNCQDPQPNSDPAAVHTTASGPRSRHPGRPRNTSSISAAPAATAITAVTPSITATPRPRYSCHSSGSPVVPPQAQYTRAAATPAASGAATQAKARWVVRVGERGRSPIRSWRSSPAQRSRAYSRKPVISATPWTANPPYTTGNTQPLGPSSAPGGAWSGPSSRVESRNSGRATRTVPSSPVATHIGKATSPAGARRPHGRTKERASRTATASMPKVSRLTSHRSSMASASPAPTGWPVSQSSLRPR